MYRPERSEGVNNMIVLGGEHSRQREQQVRGPRGETCLAHQNVMWLAPSEQRAKVRSEKGRGPGSHRTYSEKAGNVLDCFAVSHHMI